MLNFNKTLFSTLSVGLLALGLTNVEARLTEEQQEKAAQIRSMAEEARNAIYQQKVQRAAPLDDELDALREKRQTLAVEFDKICREAHQKLEESFKIKEKDAKALIKSERERNPEWIDVNAKIKEIEESAAFQKAMERVAAIDRNVDALERSFNNAIHIRRSGDCLYTGRYESESYSSALYSRNRRVGDILKPFGISKLYRKREEIAREYKERIDTALQQLRNDFYVQRDALTQELDKEDIKVNQLNPLGERADELVKQLDHIFWHSDLYEKFLEAKEDEKRQLAELENSNK